MRTNRLQVRLSCGVVLGLWAPWLAGCGTPGQIARLKQENQSLHEQVGRLERTVQQRDATNASQFEQIQKLKGFGSDRQADLFAPVRIELVSRSGGANYDGKPGDDGVNVYLRPVDRDGDAAKVPGNITVLIQDNTDLNNPRTLGTHTFSDPDTLRQAWFGKFGTSHYSLKCPFPPGVELPKSGRLNISVEFVDYLTGRTLTATKEITFSPPAP